jgi:hypothetical protein
MLLYDHRFILAQAIEAVRFELRLKDVPDRVHKLLIGIVSGNRYAFQTFSSAVTRCSKFVGSPRMAARAV